MRTPTRKPRSAPTPCVLNTAVNRSRSTSSTVAPSNPTWPRKVGKGCRVSDHSLTAFSIREPHLWLGVEVDAEACGFLLDPGADGRRQRFERLHRNGHTRLLHLVSPDTDH